MSHRLGAMGKKAVVVAKAAISSSSVAGKRKSDPDALQSHPAKKVANMKGASCKCSCCKEMFKDLQPVAS